MTTWTALTTLSDKARADALAEAAETLDPEPIGVGVFEIEDGSGLFEVGAYFTEAPDDVALALLAAVHHAAEFVISEVPETDWVAHVRRELKPVEAGRFFVYGSHDADNVPPDRTALLIEASMAFGTGHHGTTLGCLHAVDRLADLMQPNRVADIGCGTAVLAMAAASVWPDASIVASDIDPVAVDVARTNLAANGYDRIETVVAAGFGAPGLEGPFDLVLANILKGPLLDLAEQMSLAIAPGGRAVLSGLLTDQAEEVAEAYRDVGLELEHREDIGDWSALTLARKG